MVTSRVFSRLSCITVVFVDVTSRASFQVAAYREVYSHQVRRAIAAVFLVKVHLHSPM